MLRWAIPEYRLPARVLAREMEVFGALGVEVHTGARVGQDVPWSDLGRFDAVLLATGAWGERQLSCPGGDREGVWQGLAFLARVREGRAPEVGRRVAVIGGGNTAIDAARTARRLGAEVTVYYRRTAEKMRALPEEVAAARAEGIFFRFEVVPALVDEGRSRKLALNLRPMSQEEALTMRPGGAEPSSDFWTEVDTVIVAVGAEPELGFAASETVSNGRLVVDTWGRTPAARVFAAGDASSGGTGTVAGAINSGKRAALAIHSHLSGEALDERALRLVRGPGIAAEVFLRGPSSSRAGRVQAAPPLRSINLRHFPEAPRSDARQRAPEEAIWGFEETELGLPPERAAAEARSRCFHCGVCTRCDTCVQACPSAAIRREGEHYAVDPVKCTACRLCQVECPRSAITMPAVGHCVGCGYCTTMFECPALVRLPDGLVDIDRRICVDCGLCAQVCAQGAIREKTAERGAP
jgi:formate dehydrogenase major subunit